MKPILFKPPRQTRNGHFTVNNDKVRALCSRGLFERSGKHVYILMKRTRVRSANAKNYILVSSLFRQLMLIQVETKTLPT